jgi:hypothetical protein
MGEPGTGAASVPGVWRNGGGWSGRGGQLLRGRSLPGIGAVVAAGSVETFALVPLVIEPLLQPTASTAESATVNLPSIESLTTRGRPQFPRGASCEMPSADAHHGPSRLANERRRHTLQNNSARPATAPVLPFGRGSGRCGTGVRCCRSVRSGGRVAEHFGERRRSPAMPRVPTGAARFLPGAEPWSSIPAAGSGTPLHGGDDDQGRRMRRRRRAETTAVDPWAHRRGGGVLAGARHRGPADAMVTRRTASIAPPAMSRRGVARGIGRCCTWFPGFARPMRMPR